MATNIQPIALINGELIQFLIQFDAPVDYMIYKSFNVIDTLVSGISFDINNTYIIANNNIIANWTYEYDTTSNTVNININNNINISGNKIEVYIGSKITDISQINSSLVVTNIAYVEVNGNSGLSTFSEVVDIYFSTISANDITVSPQSQNQTIQSINGNNVTFSSLFLGSAYDENHLLYNVITTIPSGLIFDPSSSSVTISQPKNILELQIQSVEEVTASGVDVNYVYNSTTGNLSVNITNATQYEGQLITVTIGTKITNQEQIGNFLSLNVSLGFNNDPSTIVSTKAINMNFINKISLLQSVDSPSKLLENGVKILFTGVFTVPENTSRFNYNNFTITDSFPEGLAFDINNSSVKLDDGSSIESMINYNESIAGQIVSINFNNYSSLQGKLIFVNIGAIVVDRRKIPENLLITNTLTLVTNGNLNTEVSSNSISVQFQEYSTARQQALNNVITSISIVEDALYVLMNTELDILQRAKEIGASTYELTQVNNSIQNVVRSIAMVERYEAIKLDIANR